MGMELISYSMPMDISCISKKMIKNPLAHRTNYISAFLLCRFYVVILHLVCEESLFNSILLVSIGRTGLKIVIFEIYDINSLKIIIKSTWNQWC